MEKSKNRHGAALRWTVIAAIAAASSARATEVETGHPDLKMRWDNTVKYTLVNRLKDPSSRLVSDPNLDDGNRNFGKGVASNRLDLLSEIDASYKAFGLRASGAAWYDEAYNGSSDHNSPSTFNARSVPVGSFTQASRNLMGRKAELLDAFVYYRSSADSATPMTVRAGRHTVLYGETLFFGANGIAGTQSPIDVVKALSVPGSQFKEIIRPVNQISGQVQLSTQAAIGAYVQLEWEKTRIPASGSFLSDADIVGAGAESFLTPLGPLAINETKARNRGQAGIQFKYRPSNSDVDLGFYAVRYHDKSPQLYVRPTTGTLATVYAENVNSFGASFSTVLGGANVAGEASVRTNAPLNSDPQLDLAGTGDGRRNELFAVGKTAHVNLSMIQLFDRTAFWDSATLLGELAWNRTLSIKKNPGALDPNTTRDATAIRVLFEPMFYQVVSGADLSIPIGLGYTLDGRSSAVGKFNGGVGRGGDFSIGLALDYQKRFKLGFSYVRFIGGAGSFLTPTNPPVLSFKQSLADRDFFSMSAQYAF